VVDATAHVSPAARIGALAVVEAGATIEAGAIVSAQCFVGRDARVGEGSLLHPRVVLSFDCSVGARCIVHSGAVIGADGFGLAPTPEGYVKIAQLGAVRIGDDVEIGANTCIDRGALGDTVVEDGVKLDNLIQIGHNVHIGRMTAMAGCAAVAGSTRIGARCTFGGGAGLVGHLTIADDVHISARSTVTRSISKPGVYTGFFPLDDNRSWEKNAVTLRQLHALRERVRALERDAKARTGPAPEDEEAADPTDP
jgi:UDP-3-O-[3-hydroxymyristoyl] glucosamine N-acyltransferase